jgi:hypothetical protein
VEQLASPKTTEDGSDGCELAANEADPPDNGLLDASKNRSHLTACRDSILSVDRGNGGVDVEAAELFRYR